MILFFHLRYLVIFVRTMKKLLTLAMLSLLLVQCDALSAPSVAGPRNPVGSINDESAEYATLFAKDQQHKTQETAEVLNYLLNDNDPEDSFTALVIENTSNCNIIVRAVAVDQKHIYNLPVPRKAKNHFKIHKGNYTLKSNVCTARYYSQKSIFDSLILTIRTN